MLKPVTAVVALARGLLGRRLELGDGFSLTDAEASLAEKGVQIQGLRIVENGVYCACCFLLIVERRGT